MPKRLIDGALLLSKGKEYLDKALQKRTSSTKGETTSNKGKSNKSKSDTAVANNAAIKKRRLGKMDAVGVTVSVLEATDPIAIARNLAIYGGVRLSEKIGSKVFRSKKNESLQSNTADEARKKVVEQTVKSSKKANAFGTEQGKIFARSSARLNKSFLKRIREIEKLRNKVEKLERKGQKIKDSDRKRRQSLNRLEFDATDAGKLETFFRKMEHKVGPQRTGTSSPKSTNSDRLGGETKNSQRYRQVKQLLSNSSMSVKDKAIGSTATAAGYFILDEIFGEDSDYAAHLNSPELVKEFKDLVESSPKVKKYLNDNKLDANESSVLENHLNNNKLFDKDTYSNYVDSTIKKALQKASDVVESARIASDNEKSRFQPNTINIITASRPRIAKVNIPVKHFTLPGFYTQEKAKKDTTKHILSTRYGITPDEYEKVKGLLDATN